MNKQISSFSADKFRSFTPTFIIVLFVLIAAVFAGTLLLCVINDAFATKTVVNTYAGTKSVCAGTRYDYSVKHSICTGYKTVAATCKTTETAGPVFKPFTSTECK